MRKQFLLLLAAVLMLPVMAKAQTIVLSESFENGIPASWTQESVDGNRLWTVETGGTYPVGTIAGEKRAVLRNGSGQTEAYKTRLITPEMNLLRDSEGGSLNTPFVSFFYAADKWTADFDTLRVLYQTEPGEEWMELTTFTTAQRQWTKVMFDLPSVTDKYRLAFEGTDNMGRGIVLDSVVVRSALDCSTPYALYTTNLNDGVITLGWQSGYDTKQFLIAVANKPVDMNVVEQDELVVNAAIDFNPGNPNFTFTTPKLPTNVTYYYYVRSLCETEASEWSEQASFYMTPQVTIPYKTDFNLPAIDGSLDRVKEWSYGNNVNINMPAVNTHMYANLGNYSNDGTFALLFTGAEAVDKDIPGGSWMYAVTPEIVGADMKDLQVSFWGTVNTASRRTQARSIIVGVMSDPDNVLTFEPVRTVTVDGFRTKKEFTVEFSGYTGNARRIAFLSQFDQPNQFYIDNVLIDRIPSVKKVETVKVTPSANGAVFTWDAEQGTDYQVVVSAKEVADAAQLAAADIIKQENASAGTLTVSGLNVTTNYYVYVQSSKGGQSVWSNPQLFRTLALRDLPMRFGFEIDEDYYNNPGSQTMYPKGVALYSTGPELPYMKDKAGHESTYSLYLDQDAGYDAWAVYPAVEKVSDLYMMFYLSALNQSYVASSRLVVGVMTDPADLQTFSPVQEFNAQATWARYYVDFSSYKGEGKYIAMRWVEPENENACINYVDDVVIGERGNCSVPDQLEALTTDTSAVITWARGDATQWNVRVSSVQLNETQLDFITANLLNKVGITEPQVEIPSGLEWSSRYYVYVQALCSGNESSLWTSFSFVTDCPAYMKLPYRVDFEGVREGGRGNGFYQACWTRSNDYPYLQQSDPNNQTHTGNGAISLRAYTTYGTWVGVPELEEEVKNVQVNFWVKGSTTGESPLLIGVMDKQDDFTTFTLMDTIIVVSGWQNITYDFAEYTGTGKYICFYNPPTAANYRSLNLDDMEFRTSINQRPLNLMMTSASQTDIAFSWEGRATDNKFDVLVANATVDNPANPPAAAVVKAETVTGTTHTVTDLASNTVYYVYVKPAAGTDWAMVAIRTDCDLIDITKTYDFEEFTAGAVSPAGDFQPKCWVAGNERITPSVNVTNTIRANIPYVYTLATANTTAGGSKVLKIAQTATYWPAWTALPHMDVEDISRVIVSFTGQGTAGYYIVVGVMDNPADFSTFTAVDSVRVNGLGSGKSLNFSVELAEYTGTGKYIAFRGQNVNKAITTYIDDISFSINRCPAPRPSYSMLTDKSVRITSGMSMRNRNPWKIYWSTKELSADKLYDGTEDMTGVDSIKASATDVVAQLNNLKPSTTYYAYVAGDCEAGSSQFKVLTFKTLCPAQSIAEFGGSGSGVEDWETYTATTNGSTADLGCWIFGNKVDVGTTTGCIPYVPTSPVVDKFGKFVKLYTTASVNSAHIISPALDVDDISRYQIRFQACTGTTSTTYAHKLIVGVATDPSDVSTMVNVDTVSLALSMGQEISNFVVPLDAYMGDAQGQKGKHIFFLSEFSTANQAYIDNIRIEPIPACRIPNHLRADSASLTESGVNISWKGSASKYRVALAKETTLTPATFKKFVFSAETDTAFYAFSGLAPATNYYVYVEALCGEDGSAWATDVLSFRTNCPEEGFVITADTPYEQNFDDFANIAGFRENSCWGTVYLNTKTNAVTTSYPSLSTSAGREKTAALYMFNTKSTSAPTVTYAALPYITNNLNTLQLSFAYAANAVSTASPNRKIKVALADSMPTADNITTFDYVVFDELTSTQVYSAGYDTYSKSLESYTGNGHYIVFIADYGDGGTTGGGIYLDDIKVELIPTCAQPQGVALTEVAHEVATAVITPNPDSDAAQWQIAILPDSLTDEIVSQADIARLAKLFDASSTTVQLTGLTHSTGYKAYVRSRCGENDFSSWTNPVSFETMVKVKKNTTWCFENNEKQISNGASTTSKIPYGWDCGLVTTYAYASSYYPAIYTNSTGEGTVRYAKQGDNALRLYNYNTTSMVIDSSYVVLPYIEMEGRKAITMDVRSGQAVSSKPAALGYDTVSFGMTAKLQIGLIDSLGTIQSFRPLASYNIASKVGGIATVENNKLFDHIVVELPADLTGKQVAIIRTDHTTSSFGYLCIDSVSVSDSKGFTSPAVTAFATDTSVTLSWANEQGVAYNVYLIDQITTLYDADAAHVTKVANVTTGSYTFGALMPGKEYAAYVQIAKEEQTMGSLSPRVIFKTACQAAPAGTVYGFDDNWELTVANGTSLYYHPACWVVGNASSQISTAAEGSMTTSNYSHAPYLRESYASSTHHLSDSSALFFSNISSYPAGMYAAMPLVAADLDNMQLEFYMRSVYESPTYHTPTSVSATYANNSQHIIIGTMTDPADFTTFHAIDTVEYTYKGNEDLVEHREGTVAGTPMDSDPTGLKFWQKKVVPLKGAIGAYVTFYTDRATQMYIDDVSIQQRSGWLAPNSLKLLSRDSVSAMVSWKGYQQGQYVLRVATDKALLNNVYEYPVDGTSFLITGLNPQTQYFWAVMQKGQGDEQSAWSAVERFRTSARMVSTSYTTGFEMEEGWYALPGFYQDAYKVTNGWEYDTKTATASVTSRPYNRVDAVPTGTTASYAYSHRGMYALELNTTTSANGAYAVMPPVDCKRMDTLQVNFYMSALYRYNNGTNAGKISGSGYASASYKHAVEVGTCTNPDDLTTFVPLDTVYYNSELKSGMLVNESNDFMYEPKSVSLENAVGPYVYFRSDFNLSNHIWIDDVSFQPYNGCRPANMLATESVTDSAAVLTWEHFQGIAWTVEVAEDIDFTNIVKTVEKATTDKVTVTGLEPNKTYYWRVQQFCEEDGVADLSGTAVFNTWKAPLFNEDFMVNVLPEGWADITGSLTLKEVEAAAATLPDERGTVWSRSTTGKGLPTSHYMTTLMSTARKAWLLTPVISLSATDTAMLQFDLAVTMDGAEVPVSFNDNMRDDQFMVVISDDAGMTWKTQNAVIWNNDSIDNPADANYRYGIAEKSLRDVSAEGEKVRIDLSAYMGKPVRIAFYAENTKVTVSGQRGMDIHIDNIHVNYVIKDYETVDLCQFEDYENVALGYYIDGDAAEAGVTTLQKMTLAMQTGENDTLHILNAAVREAPIYEFADTIRTGTVYNKYNFAGKTRSGRYKMKFANGASTGCDSVCVLNLTVLNQIHIEDVQQLCYTQLPYVLNQKKYDRTGVYRDTVYSGVDNLPDTTYTLVLTVLSVYEETINDTICYGGTYSFGDEQLTASGQYIHRMETAAGCDSVITLNLTVLPEKRVELTELRCNGSSYEFNGKTITTDGDYTATLMSKDGFGCDSTVILHISFMDAILNEVTDTICYGGTYKLGDDVLTAGGDYTKTLVASMGCDSTVTLHLTVLPELIDTITDFIAEGDVYSKGDFVGLTGPGYYTKQYTSVQGCDSTVVLDLQYATALNVLQSDQLTLIPNVINRNGTVTVQGDFTDSELRNMTVAVYDALGKCVAVHNGLSNPVTVSDFPVAGVYSVRIYTGNGDAMVGRVVVK